MPSFCCSFFPLFFSLLFSCLNNNTILRSITSVFAIFCGHGSHFFGPVGTFRAFALPEEVDTRILSGPCKRVRAHISCAETTAASESPAQRFSGRPLWNSLRHQFSAKPQFCDSLPDSVQKACFRHGDTPATHSHQHGDRFSRKFNPMVIVLLGLLLAATSASRMLPCD